jgi:hypothetical protein
MCAGLELEALLADKHMDRARSSDDAGYPTLASHGVISRVSEGA